MERSRRKMMATEVIDDRSKSRYELFADDALVGFADYELRADRLAILHVEVDQHLGGHGLGRALVDAVLVDARSRDLAVLPRCPFTRKVIAENQSDYLDLVPTDVRDEFGLPI
jgi:predicted GNAT family acetyltransferase